MYKNVVLSSAIIAKDVTAKEQVAAIERTFAEGRELLLHWRKVTQRMYPSRRDLLDRISKPSKLSLARLHKNDWLMTDTCATAQKFKRLLQEAIETTAKEAGISEDQICIYQADCWHHLRNVWISAVVTALSEHLSGILAEDLEKIPALYRVNTNISGLMIAMEKYFGLQANYVKVRNDTQ